MMTIIVVAGSLMLFEIVAIILYSMLGKVNTKLTVFLFWMWWTGLFGISLTKVLMLETPLVFSIFSLILY